MALMVTLTAVQSFSAPTSVTAKGCSCGAPSSAVVTDLKSNSISMEWSPGTGAVDYELWFVRMNDAYTSPHTSQKGTSVTYTGLVPGRYIFYAKTICGHATSDVIVLEDIIIG